MPLLSAILLFVLGAILGSFANVCIWRLPRGESIAWPPSHCVHCQGQLKPWHLVPILSWVFLGGKCAMCGGRISFRYPVVEMASALLFGAIGWQWGISLLTLRYCILTLALVISVGTDLSHQEIPDQVSLGASAILGLIALVTLSWGNLIGGAVTLRPIVPYRCSQSRRHGRRRYKACPGDWFVPGLEIGSSCPGSCFHGRRNSCHSLTNPGQTRKGLALWPLFSLGSLGSYLFRRYSY
jgi:prepilin signal peptidase PulO-like enzyme (type II secretory pathway)